MSLPAPAQDGLFDLQVNGFAGVDFQADDLSLDAMERVARELRARGVTRILHTLVTERIDTLCRRLEHMETLCARSSLLRATVAGHHLEGPWLSPETGYCGAHDPACMVPAREADAERLLAAAGGRLRLVTLAPERPGTDAVTAWLTARGVRVAAGHTAAEDGDIGRAIAAGLTLCTHLGNAVPALLPRHDNVVQRLLARDELTAVFIPDGLHLPPAALKNFTRAKPRERILFTTDCMAAAGAPPGRHTLGRVVVEVGADGVVREPGKPNFAGSSLTLDRGVDNVVRLLGWTPAEARAACAERVARALGLPEHDTPID